MTALAEHLSQTEMTMETFGAMFVPPVNKSTVSRWADGKIPAERVLEIERISGVSRHDLRPDLYPRDKTRAA